jgi:hypothetical protein
MLSSYAQQFFLAEADVYILILYLKTSFLTIVKMSFDILIVCTRPQTLYRRTSPMKRKHTATKADDCLNQQVSQAGLAWLAAS